jgi:hypothetical protein
MSLSVFLNSHRASSWELSNCKFITTPEAVAASAKAAVAAAVEDEGAVVVVVEEGVVVVAHAGPE